MKTIKTTIAILAVSIFAMSCSKDDDAPAPVKQPSVEASFENTTEVNITDAVGTNIPDNSLPSNTISNIEVSANGTILDLKKLVLEMNIKHNQTRDLSFTLIAPDGTESLFVKRVGSTGDYFGESKLRFCSTFTTPISNSNTADIPAGDYKESQGAGSAATPILLPVFSTLQGKNISGSWKLRATDDKNGNIGKIISWKLIFQTGALNQ